MTSVAAPARKERSRRPTAARRFRKVAELQPAGQQYATWDMRHDSLNLRCFDQRRRFGFDLLNPLDRYTVGLTNATVYDRSGALVPNPLFAARAGKGARSNSLISLSVIVGAPWQDLATDDSRSSDALSFLSAPDLEVAQRFQLLIGAGEYGKPTDPLMLESTDVRSGKNPLTNEFLVAASSTNPLANSGNGHEQNIPQLDDLQYACTFPLPVPVECQAADPSCECAPDKGGNATAVIAANSPLCQPPSGGPPETTQYFGKGYPGLRQLRVARALGARAAYGSICPKQTSDSTSRHVRLCPSAQCPDRSHCRHLEVGPPARSPPNFFVPLASEGVRPEASSSRMDNALHAAPTGASSPRRNAGMSHRLRIFSAQPNR